MSRQEARGHTGSIRAKIQEPLVDLVDSPDMLFVAEAFLDALSSIMTDPSPQLGELEESLHSCSEVLRGSSWNEKPGHVVLDDFRNSADVRRDHRLRARHGFDDRTTEGLLVRWTDDDVELPKQARHIVAKSQELDSSFEPELSSPVLQVICVSASECVVSDDLVRRRNTLLLEDSCHL